MNNLSRTLNLATLKKRVRDLNSDGYTVYICHNDPELILYKLVHKSGKRITLKLYVNSGQLYQRTDSQSPTITTLHQS